MLTDGHGLLVSSSSFQRLRGNQMWSEAIRIVLCLL
jgi:hypothetical protein